MRYPRKQMHTFYTMKAADEWLDKLEAKVEKNRDKITKYEKLGLFIFVAIPLPGTGGWTGALVASFMNIKPKYSIPTIFVGVFGRTGVNQLLAISDISLHNAYPSSVLLIEIASSISFVSSPSIVIIVLEVRSSLPDKSSSSILSTF